MDYVNFHFRMDAAHGEHRFAYDFETLGKLLRDVGFTEVRERAFDPELDSFERRYSLFAAGRKPG